ncbi:MAG: hypothetical protein HYR60_28635 [Acidobacteria bacterium]|nr:hypothetical protein [Acidobacteriota bacterium]
MRPGRRDWRGALAGAVAAAVVPWWTGLSFLDALVVIPYASLFAGLVAAGRAVDAFHGAAALEGLSGGSQERMLAGKAGRAALKGWGLGALGLAAALGVVNARNWHGSLLLPDGVILIDAAVVSLSAAVWVAAWGTVVALDATSAEAARSLLRRILLYTALGLFLAYQYTPGEWTASIDLTAAGITAKSLALSAALLATAAPAFRKALGRLREGREAGGPRFTML